LLLRIEVADRHDQTVCAPDPDALTRSEREIRESADAERCGGREKPVPPNTVTVRPLVATRIHIRHFMSHLLTA